MTQESTPKPLSPGARSPAFSLRVLITAGPTREPIDAVRFIGNRSSGKMGFALVQASIDAGHEVTLILGPPSAPPPVIAWGGRAKRIDVETAEQMRQAVMSEFPRHDLLIMAAAVSDYRPKVFHEGKLTRGGPLTIECEPTPDIIAAASAIKRPDQRTIGFSLESAGNVERAREKLRRKNLDLIIYNPPATMDSESIEPILLYPGGRSEALPPQSKEGFAVELLDRAVKLFDAVTDKVRSGNPSSMR